MMKTIVTVLTILGFAFGAYFYFEKNFAKAGDVQRVEQKADKTLQIMEYKFKAIQLETVENRIYKIKEGAGEVPRDPIVRENLEQLKRDREKILREMEALEEKK